MRIHQRCEIPRWRPNRTGANEIRDMIEADVQSIGVGRARTNETSKTHTVDELQEQREERGPRGTGGRHHALHADAEGSRRSITGRWLAVTNREGASIELHRIKFKTCHIVSATINSDSVCIYACSCCSISFIRSCSCSFLISSAATCALVSGLAGDRSTRPLNRPKLRCAYAGGGCPGGDGRNARGERGGVFATRPVLGTALTLDRTLEAGAGAGACECERPSDGRAVSGCVGSG
jgi:hypothetical protein